MNIAGPSAPGRWKNPESFGTEDLATVAHLFDCVISVLQPRELYGRGRATQKTCVHEGKPCTPGKSDQFGTAETSAFTWLFGPGRKSPRF